MSLYGGSGTCDSESQSRTSSPCPSCGENSLEVTSHNFEEQNVCTGCGVVVETTFTNLVNQNAFVSAAERTSRSSSRGSYNNYPRFPCDPDKVRLGHVKKEYSKQLHCLLRQLQANKAVEEMASHVLEKANLVGQCLSGDQVIGACAYIAFRNNEVPMSFKAILGHLSPETTPGSLIKAVKRILNLTGLKIQPSFSLAQNVEFTLSPAVFWDSQGTRQEMLRISEDTTKMLELLQEFDTFSLVIRPDVIVSAAYLAYVNADLNKRKKITWNVFLEECHLASTVSNNCSRKIVRVLLQQLQLMASQLPWLGGRKFNSAKLEVLYYYNDIVEAKEMIKEKLRICGDNRKRNVEINEDVLGIVKKEPTDKVKKEVPDSIKKEVPDSIKREVTDEEIDKEIENYLRTPQEIEMVKRIKRGVYSFEKVE